MGTPFLMPALSPTMTEGGIVQWRKQEGNTVRAGDVLLDIETDKAIVEVEAPFDGFLERILYPAGANSVVVGTPICMIREGEVDSASTLMAVAPSVLASNEQASLQLSVVPKSAVAARKPVTPVARLLAKERGIDVTSLAGSGPGGRVVRSDVLAAITGREFALQHASQNAPYGVPSVQAISQFHLSIDCQIDGILHWKQELAAEGVKLTLNDFVVAACARVLRRVPLANVTWINKTAVVAKNVNIAVAVSTKSGRVTPVLFGAQTKGLQGLSSELRSLIDDARHGRLAADQCEGSTFAVVNVGRRGGRELIASISATQTGILTVGEAEQRPVARNGEVVLAMVMTCTLSADPNAIDGTVAAEFLAEIRRSLEQPLTMVL